MEKEIISNNDASELEILEFKLGNELYGINVAKVREIVPYSPVTPMPNAHPSIEGVFMPRDRMITAIDLRNCLGMGKSGRSGSFIITNFNKLDIAFHVDSVSRIQRVSWRDVNMPDSTISSIDKGISTGIVKLNGRLIIILDFERIMSDVSPEALLRTEDIEEMGIRKKSDLPILIADDSLFLNKQISDSLKKAGYVNLIECPNGKKAWDYIVQHAEDGDLRESVALVITDVEMPEMDGHTLTRLIKTNKHTRFLPVIIFSSLVNDDIRKKGEQLADCQLSKPEIGSLVKNIDALLHLEQG